MMVIMKNSVRIRHARYLVRRLVDVGGSKKILTFIVSSQVTPNDEGGGVGYAELVFDDETRQVSVQDLSDTVNGLFETAYDLLVWDDDILGTACEATGLIQLTDSEVAFIEFMEDAASKLPSGHPLIPRFRVDGLLIP